MALRTREKFEGHIAGLGTTSGLRIVIGAWARSPFGVFTDVMLQEPGGHRTLFAPERRIAEYVSATYTFDEVQIVPVTSTLGPGVLNLNSERLHLSLSIGGRTAWGRALRLVPTPLSTSTLFLRAIDPVASRLIDGVHTAGSANEGRKEYYGVRDLHALTKVTGRLDGVDVGTLAPLDPPVTFGFSSAPPEPSFATVTTTIIR